MKEMESLERGCKIKNGAVSVEVKYFNAETKKSSKYFHYVVNVEQCKIISVYVELDETKNSPLVGTKFDIKGIAVATDGMKGTYIIQVSE